MWVVDIDAFAAEACSYRKVGRQRQAEPDFPAGATFSPILINASEVVCREAKLDKAGWRFEQVRFLESGCVTLHDRAGIGFQPQMFAAAAPGLAGTDIFP